MPAVRRSLLRALPRTSQPKAENFLALTSSDNSTQEMIELLSNLLRIQAFLKTHVEQPADIKRRGVKTQRYTGDKEVECVISYRRNGTPDQISLSCRNSYSLQCTFSAFPDKLIMNIALHQQA